MYTLYSVIDFQQKHFGSMIPVLVLLISNQVIYSQVIGSGKPSVHHAAVVLFLEFFAFGLLAIPMLDVSFPTFFLLILSCRWHALT